MVSAYIKRVSILILPWRLQAQKLTQMTEGENMQGLEKQFTKQWPAGLKVNSVSKWSKLVPSQHQDGTHSFLIDW